MRATASIILATAVLIAAKPALAQADLQGRSGSQNLQGDTSAWRADPHMRAFYEAVRAACAQGCARADRPALEAASRVIFGNMAKAHGVNPAVMQDHLKAVPAQMLALGQDDPKVLETQKAFIEALFGPE